MPPSDESTDGTADDSQKPSPLGEGGPRSGSEEVVSSDDTFADEHPEEETTSDASLGLQPVSPEGEPASPKGEAKDGDAADGEPIDDTPPADESTDDTAEGDTPADEATDDTANDTADDQTDTSATTSIPVTITGTPEAAVVTVRAIQIAIDNGDGDPLLPEETPSAEDEAIDASIPAKSGNTWSLRPGEYTYSAAAEGYISIEDIPFTVAETDESLALTFALEPEAEPEPVPFDQSQTVNGVLVTVQVPTGAFPAGSELSVKRVPVYRQRQADAAIDEVREDDVNVAASYTFDIKVIDPETMEEFQPAEGFDVQVSFALSEAADDNLEANVYHVTSENGELTAEALDTDVDESTETVTATTDGFSLYTVEFTYKQS